MGEMLRRAMGTVKNPAAIATAVIDPEWAAEVEIARIHAESDAKIAKQKQDATGTLQATINRGTVNAQRTLLPQESAPTPEARIEGVQQATEPRRKYRGDGAARATRGGAGIRLT